MARVKDTSKRTTRSVSTSRAEAHVEESKDKLDATTMDEVKEMVKTAVDEAMKVRDQVVMEATLNDDQHSGLTEQQVIDLVEKALRKRDSNTPPSASSGNSKDRGLFPTMKEMREAESSHISTCATK